MLFAGFAAVITEEQSFVTITTTTKNVTEGDAFSIMVRATAHTPVNAIDITIAYPENQIEVTGFNTGESVITLWTEEPHAENGLIYLTGGTFQKGFLGEHLIAEVRVRATESGTAYVAKDSATFIAGDGLGTEVLVADSNLDETSVRIAGADGTIVGDASVFIVTDIDGDGNVGFSDISTFMAAWFDKHTVFDFNGDGKMTFRDFSILLADSFFK